MGKKDGNERRKDRGNVRQKSGKRRVRLKRCSWTWKKKRGKGKGERVQYVINAE